MEKKIDLGILIEEAKSQKQASQTRLVNLFWAEVKAYILSITGEEDSAEELTTLTFTKVLSKLSLYNADFDFKTWVTSIAHNTTIDFLRKKNKLQEADLDDNTLGVYTPSPEQSYIEKQNAENFEKLINKLPEKYKEIIKLRFIEEKKLSEIAQELNLSLPNVKVSIMRAKKLLQEMLS